MPRFQFTPSPTQLAHLRAAALKRFGRAIDSDGECIALAKVLALQPGGSLSRTWLRRFFLKQESYFHRNSLDKLALYAEGCDFAYFCRLLEAGSAAGEQAAAQAIEPLSLQGPSYAASLQQGYVLGMRIRPGRPTEAVEAQALAQAATPYGQKLFVESFVDLAHVNGAYGAVVERYLEHATAWDRQIFGYSVLFLGAFLAEDEPRWRQRLAQLRAVPVPHGMHPFPLGRRAFALLMADRWSRPITDTALDELRQQARTCAVAEADAGYPAFYNYFPAGYYFLVAEALFLRGQFAALNQWLDTTDAFLERVAYCREPNVFREVLDAFRSVALLRTGAPAEARHLYQDLSPSVAVADNRWLWDYYQVYLWLTDLHFEAGAEGSQAKRASAHAAIEAFAQERNMPFFRTVARHIVNR